MTQLIEYQVFKDGCSIYIEQNPDNPYFGRMGEEIGVFTSRQLSDALKAQAGMTELCLHAIDALPPSLLTALASLTCSKLTIIKATINSGFIAALSRLSISLGGKLDKLTFSDCGFAIDRAQTKDLKLTIQDLIFDSLCSFYDSVDVTQLSLFSCARRIYFPVMVYNEYRQKLRSLVCSHVASRQQINVKIDVEEAADPDVDDFLLEMSDDPGQYHIDIVGVTEKRFYTILFQLDPKRVLNYDAIRSLAPQWFPYDADIFALRCSKLRQQCDEIEPNRNGPGLKIGLDVYALKQLPPFQRTPIKKLLLAILERGLGCKRLIIRNKDGFSLLPEILGEKGAFQDYLFLQKHFSFELYPNFVTCVSRAAEYILVGNDSTKPNPLLTHAGMARMLAAQARRFMDAFTQTDDIKSHIDEYRLLIPALLPDKASLFSLKAMLLFDLVSLFGEWVQWVSAESREAQDYELAFVTAFLQAVFKIDPEYIHSSIRMSNPENTEKYGKMGAFCFMYTDSELVVWRGEGPKPLPIIPHASVNRLALFTPPSSPDNSSVINNVTLGN